MKVTNTVNFGAAASKMKAAIALYGKTAALKLEADAKHNKPWTDDTANAKNSIQGTFELSLTKASLVLSGNVDYFKYLEFANERKYAILEPTIQKFSAEVLQGYQKVVDR